MLFIRVLAALMVGALMLGAPGAAVQGAATTFTVTKTADTADGTCDTDCSLREAITAANANAGTDTIAFAIPGAGPHTIQPASPLPTITDPVVIDGYTQSGASANTNSVASGLGLNTVLKIELDGTNAGASGDGLTITAGSSTVRGLVLNRFLDEGLHLLTNGGNVVAGNFIGTDVAGTAVLGNGGKGIQVTSAGNTIGGTNAADRNLVSGTATGILIRSGATGNLLQGNFVGTDATGNVGLGNTNWPSVQLLDAPNNTVGGTETGAGNVLFNLAITGSGSTGNVVQGNLIGTNVAGTAALGNPSNGLDIHGGASNNVIGGTTAEARNIISGNGLHGVIILAFASGANANVIQGNFIGTDITGTAALGNGGLGVLIAQNGGDTGVSTDNVIGGTAEGAGNTIAFNSDRGVLVLVGTSNAILGNSMFSNTGLGIDLSGITANDAGDGDTGPNNGQNFPVLTSAVTGGSPIVIGGTLDSAASTDFRVEFFANSACDASGNGEGETFLGAATVTTDAGGSAAFSVLLTKAVSLGAAITATATDPDNNTSEFSACVTAGPAAPVPGITLQALAGLAALLAGAFAWTVRRRRAMVV